MDQLWRNQTTAEQATALEDGDINSFTNKPYSRRFRELLRQRRVLPVSAARSRFLELYQKSQVIVLTSDTGAGKTTQIPQFILYDEFASDLMVACTQPRRFAATSVARRVAEEMDVKLGTTVGYSVRFESRESHETRLGYMTDGKLLVGAMSDPLFSKYCCIIIDEAHERTVPTDILLALLKHAIKDRHDLKIVIMSATMDANAFQKYFGGGEVAPIIHIPGNAFHVKEWYIKTPEQGQAGEALEGPTPNYLHTSVSLVEHIYSTEGPGDILVFMPSEHEVESACVLIKKKCVAMTVLPLYGSLPPARQQRGFESASERKCVVTTNIAETSLTIEGIVYVVDRGLANQSMFNPRIRATIIHRAAISQASANQRKGRAGRTRPGTCYRLYTQEDFAKLRSGNRPAIAQADMRFAILQIQNSGFHDIWSFDWLDQPAPEALVRAISDLKWMGFLDKNAKITEEGKQAARCPIDSIWFYTILQGMKFGCLQEMISLAALSSTQNSIFLRPYIHRYAADLIGRPNFGHGMSDHICLLNAYHAWHDVNHAYEQDFTAKWSEMHGLSDRTMREVSLIHCQLQEGLRFLLRGRRFPAAKFNDPEYADNIRKALAAGLFLNSAIKVKGEDTYKTCQKNAALLSPESALVSGDHEWVVCSTLAMTNRLYLVTCTRIEPEWIADMPYFAEENVLKDANGQPKVAIMQESLARARGRIEAEKRRDVGAEKPQ